MAKIKMFKCDRCGEVMENPNSVLGIRASNGYHRYFGVVMAQNNHLTNGVERPDLCPDCVDSFDEWWHTPETGGYDERND